MFLKIQSDLLCYINENMLKFLNVYLFYPIIKMKHNIWKYFNFTFFIIFSHAKIEITRYFIKVMLVLHI